MSDQCPHCGRSTDIPISPICGRCDKRIQDGWEEDWPNYGRIHLGFAAQAFAFLGGAKHIADDEHFEWWKKGHPAMVKNEAQEVIFEWGNGVKFDSPSFRLCRGCQKHLLRVIGEFFGIPEEVARIRKRMRR